MSSAKQSWSKQAAVPGPLFLQPSSHLCLQMVLSCRRGACSICLDSLKKRTLLSMPCGHAFHKICVEETMTGDSFDSHSKCPTCRRPCLRTNSDYEDWLPGEGAPAQDIENFLIDKPIILPAKRLRAGCCLRPPRERHFRLVARLLAKRAKAQ